MIEAALELATHKTARYGSVHYSITREFWSQLLSIYAGLVFSQI